MNKGRAWSHHYIIVIIFMTLFTGCSQLHKYLQMCCVMLLIPLPRLIGPSANWSTNYSLHFQ